MRTEPLYRIAAQGHDMAHADLVIIFRPPRRHPRALRRRRSDARPASGPSRPASASRWHAYVRGSNRRRHRSPGQSAARSAQAARSLPTANAPSPRSSAERIRTIHAASGRVRSSNGWRVEQRSLSLCDLLPAGDPHAFVACEPQRDGDLAVGILSGAIFLCSVTSRSAAASHCETVSGAKPRRRCACSSRRNSRSCGAKSITSRRPPGTCARERASLIARAPSSR